MSKPQKSKRFVYNLQALLKVREIREKQEQDKFAEAEKKFLEEKKKEEEIKNFQSQCYAKLREIMSGEKGMPNVQEIMMRKVHLEVLQGQVEEQIKKTEEAEKAKEEQREALTKAIKEKKVIEKDKEKTREAWKKLMDKEEGKFLDDISTVGFEMKRRQAEAEDKR